MSYRYWRGGQAFEQRAFYEKAYRREFLAPWDAKWHGLSVRARYTFAHDIKIPNIDPGGPSNPASVSIDGVPPDVLRELAASGFVELRRAGSRELDDRVVALDATHDFASRIRILRRVHLLAANQPSEIVKYVDQAFFSHQLTSVLIGVLKKAGVEGYWRLDETLGRYVMQHRWPGWVAESLNNPLAKRILDVVMKVGNAVPLAELPGRIDGSDPKVVRSVVNDLIAYLALFEDLHPETWDLMVGLLPAVRENLIRASQPRQRPSLVACDHPKEVGPQGSVLINDLRALLLEVVGAPPRLRKDFSLYEKDYQRFQAALEPLVPWLLDAMRLSEEERVNESLSWARELELVKQVPQDSQIRLQLSSKGHQWVSSGFEEQYTMIYDEFTAFTTRGALSSPYDGRDTCGWNSFSKQGAVDMRFLGSQVSVLKLQKGTHVVASWAATDEDNRALRQHLDRALSDLKPGVFYRLDSVEAYVAFKAHNPINCGLAPEQVAVHWAGRPVAPLEEEREEMGRRLIKLFTSERLIPLGCFRAAVDDSGSLCIAREPRYDAYFGRKIARTDLAPDPEAPGRVIVQPDFSVIVIGLNPAAVADLAPFCERSARSSGQGAMVLKITRESVVKAVNLGLTAAEIVSRLERHTSKQVPANVLHEVKDWSNWVRRVTLESLTVLRCPDTVTVDRVIAVMGKKAERVNDTLVAFDRAKLTTAQREKLKNHGILVRTDAEAKNEKP